MSNDDDNIGGGDETSDDNIVNFQQHKENAARAKRIDELLARPPETMFAALAALNRVDYDQLRREVADRLGIRVSSVDAEVDAHKPARAAGGILFEDVQPWTETVGTAALLNEIAAELSRYIVMPAASRDAVALWTLLTWAIEATSIFPFLVISSPLKRCGKSTLLILLRQMVRRPLLAANVSAAAIFRTIEKYSPSLLLDEAETWARGNEELRGILNAGHSRDTAHILRVEGDAHEPRSFNCYCPRALAGIGTLADTIVDRSIVIKMQRRGPLENVTPLRQDRLNLGQLQQRCTRWAADHLETLCAAADPHVPAELNDRAADNWRQLLTIADMAGSDWPARARKAAAVLTTADAESIQALLLQDIAEIFAANGADRIRSVDLIERLHKYETRPWAEWGRLHKPMTVIQLARQLAAFEIRPDTVRFSNTTDKGYLLSWFETAFAHYVSPTPPSVARRPVTRSQPCKNKGLSDMSPVTRDPSRYGSPVINGAQPENVTTERSRDGSAVTGQIEKNTEKNSGCYDVTGQKPKKRGLKKMDPEEERF